MTRPRRIDKRTKVAALIACGGLTVAMLLALCGVLWIWAR